MRTAHAFGGSFVFTVGAANRALGGAVFTLLLPLDEDRP